MANTNGMAPDCDIHNIMVIKHKMNYYTRTSQGIISPQISYMRCGLHVIHHIINDIKHETHP